MIFCCFSFSLSEIAAASFYVSFKVLQQKREAGDVTMSKNLFDDVMREALVTRTSKVYECVKNLMALLRREPQSDFEKEMLT